MESIISLESALIWIIREGGAAALAYYAMEHVRVLVELQAELKRYVAWAITGVLAAGFYMAALGMNYVATPVGWAEWVEVLFATIAAAILAGQALHARLQGSKKPPVVVDNDGWFV